MARTRASTMIDIISLDHLGLLRACGGYYQCPLDRNGKRAGPLVGYAGKYQDNVSGQMKQFVGDVYYNFAKVEKYPHVLHLFAAGLAAKFTHVLNDFDYVLGAPMGGIVLAHELSRTLDCRFAYAEKKVHIAASGNRREQSGLVFGRHEIESKSKIILVEDVCNNFSTTEQVKHLLLSAGATLMGIVCLVNRSPDASWKNLPVISLEHIPTPQYRQNNPEVAADISVENVVWKPKDDWGVLAAAMKSGEA